MCLFMASQHSPSLVILSVVWGRVWRRVEEGAVELVHDTFYFIFLLQFGVTVGSFSELHKNTFPHFTVLLFVVPISLLAMHERNCSSHQ